MFNNLSFFINKLSKENFGETWSTEHCLDAEIKKILPTSLGQHSLLNPQDDINSNLIHKKELILNYSFASKVTEVLSPNSNISLYNHGIENSIYTDKSKKICGTVKNIETKNFNLNGVLEFEKKVIDDMEELFENDQNNRDD